MKSKFLRLGNRQERGSVEGSEVGNVRTWEKGDNLDGSFCVGIQSLILLSIVFDSRIT